MKRGWKNSEINIIHFDGQSSHHLHHQNYRHLLSHHCCYQSFSVCLFHYSSILSSSHLLPVHCKFLDDLHNMFCNRYLIISLFPYLLLSLSLIHTSSSCVTAFCLCLFSYLFFYDFILFVGCRMIFPIFIIVNSCRCDCG